MLFHSLLGADSFRFRSRLRSRSRTHSPSLAIVLGIAATFAATFALVSSAAAELPPWSYQELAPAPVPAGPAPPDLSVELVLDDGTAEGAFGVGGTAARQFLWFQRFAPPTVFDLEEIWVLFPADPAVVPGAPIQLVVYQDDDGDPSAGAELLLARDEVIQFADGATFSVYPIAQPLAFSGLSGGGEILIGVVNRYVVSGVTPLHEPAALDTSAPDGRAWVATWTGDPPDPPLLPPDQSLFPIDLIVAGDWMIRGFGTVPTPIPTAGETGLALLAVLTALVGCWRLRLA